MLPYNFARLRDLIEQQLGEAASAKPRSLDLDLELDLDLDLGLEQGEAASAKPWSPTITHNHLLSICIRCYPLRPVKCTSSSASRLSRFWRVWPCGQPAPPRRLPLPTCILTRARHTH